MHVLILGTRGIPSRHSGFETFAQDLALFLRSRNHEVTVYCQVPDNETAREDIWNGIRRVLIPAGSNSIGTMHFDWKREKWSLPARLWFWFNEWAGARFAHHLVADHPEIGRHLSRHTALKKITVIPYGADPVNSAPEKLIQQFNLSPKGYYLLIARPEPENSILDIVQAYSIRQSGLPLVLLGNYSQKGTRYQK